MSNLDRKVTSGTIAGFSQIVIGPNGTVEDGLEVSYSSYAEMVIALTRIRNELDPKLYSEIIAQVEQHINVIGNPHGLTIADVITDVVGDIFSKEMPGTIPTGLSYSYTPDISETTVDFERSSRTSYVDIDGVLNYADNNTIVVDYSLGMPLVPMFAEMVNILSSQNVPLVTVTINGTLTTSPELGPDGESLSYRYTDDTNVGSHGVHIPYTTNVNGVHSVSFFIKPLNNATIRVRSTIGTMFEFSHDTIVASEGIDVTKIDLNDGWYRLIASFYTNTDPGIIEILKTDGGMTTYQGNGSPAFDIFGMQLVNIRGAHPYMPDGILSGSTMTLPYGIYGTDGSMSVSFIKSDNATKNMISDMAGVPICAVSNTSFDTMGYQISLKGGNNISTVVVSYYDNKGYIKSILSERSIPSYYQLASGGIQILPFDGYLKNVQLYSKHVSETDAAFLVGE